MLAIGTELAEQGNRVILTTTTHIRPFSEPLVRGLFLCRTAGGVMGNWDRYPIRTASKCSVNIC